MATRLSNDEFMQRILEAEEKRDTAVDPAERQRWADIREGLFRMGASGQVEGLGSASGPISPENPYVQPGSSMSYVDQYEFGGQPTFQEYAETSGLAAAPATTGVATGQGTDDVTGPSDAAAAWSPESDPIYQQYMQRAQSQFNQARANALGTLQYQEEGINRALGEREATSEEARRRLAGNYARRGMMGGARGAYYQAQDRANARELARRTDLREQLSELNRQFVANYGAPGTDWLGTIRGQEVREDAIQAALNALIPQYTNVG